MKPEKSITYYIRALHRDIGFFIIGLTIIYCISGILLIYKDTGFLKNEKTIEKHLPSDVEPQKLGMILHLKDFRILKTENEIVYFKDGTFNKSTGIASYRKDTLPLVLEKFTSLHKSSTKEAAHWFSLMYGILLFFLSVSAFWMYKPGSKPLRRGIAIAGTGVAVTAVLLFL